MLELKDFFHLPQLATAIEPLVAGESGLILVAGLDPRSHAPPGTADGFLPSGRATIFRILVRQILEARRPSRAIVVSGSRDVVRVPRGLKRRVEIMPVRAAEEYAAAIAAAARRRPTLLVVDQLDPETAAAALQAAQSGLRVLSQIDTIFHGADVLRALQDWRLPADQLAAVRWVITVQRLAILCLRCRQPQSPPPQLADQLAAYPDLASAQFYQANGCPDCRHTGRRDEVTAFDVFRAGDSNSPSASLLPLEEYVLRLAAGGYVALEDALGLESDRLHRTYQLLTASERALRESNVTLQRKLLELEAANRVLQQRTEALISLQDVGHALISAAGLDDLAQRVCRHAREMCGADRIALYFWRDAETAELLATSGWEAAPKSRQVALSSLLGDPPVAGPVTYRGLPPGITPAQPVAENTLLRAGLHVPLIAQDKPVGAMIVHATQKTSFAPGEVALLQTFADQSALAIQRAGLIQSLSEKIAQLEAAQAELVQKERLEQELDLARQVQQSMMPRIFPLAPGYTFAARYLPARHVGGDFYDVISLDADRFGLVIGDVSDKGMPSALYMALTRSLLLAEARRERSPAAVLRSVHHLLLALGAADMFVTLFYGVLEASARQLTYARAGHDHPLLLRQGAAHRLAGEGTVLGIAGLESAPLSEERLELHPGDRLVLYTDGLTDALDKNGRFFGLSRLTQVLQRNAAHPPADLCQAVFAELASFQQGIEQFDDMTMLVVNVEA